jgi:TP901 family phage tail tape measure protein
MAVGSRKLVVEFIGDTSNLEKAFNRAGDTSSKRGKQISDASKGIALGVGGIAVAAVKTAADYQTSMNTLQAVSGATGRQMKQLGALAVKLGADTKLPGTSAKDASEAMTEMVKSGVSLKDTMEGVRSTLVLSAAAGVSNARAAEIASNALNTFKLRGKQVAAVADELANTANASSVEINDVADALQMAGAVFSGFQAPVLGAKGALTELNVAIGLLGNAGIKGSDAGTSLKQTLLQLTGPSNKAKDTMKALYIAAKDAGASQKLLADVTREGATVRGKDLDKLIAHNKALGGSADIAYTATGSMRSLKDIIALVTKGTSKMTQEEKNSYLTQIFGADATRSIIALMKAGPSAWDKMTHSVTKQGSAQALANAKMKGLNGAIESLKSTVETLAITFGTTLLPPLTMLIQKLAGLGPFLQKNKTLITIVVGALGALAAGTWAVNLAMSANPFVAVAIALAALGFALVKAYNSSETFRNVVHSVFAALEVAAMAVKTAMIDAVHWVTGAVHTVVNEVKQWDTLGSVVKRIFGLITGYARLLFDSLKLIFKAGMVVLGPILAGYWAAIKDIFSGAWKAIKGIVTGNFQVLRGIVQIIGGLFKGDFHQVWEGIKTVFHGGITALKGILGGAWDILKAPVDAVAAGLHDAFANTWGRIKGVFRSGVNAVIDFLNILIKAINFLPGIPDIKTIGNIGGGGGNRPAQADLGKTGHLARGGAFARTGGMVTQPMTFMGEEAPRHPEYIIPTNPAYRNRARGLVAQAALAVGFAQGGAWGQQLSKGQLEADWTAAGGDPKMANLMAAIALAESDGYTRRPNSTGSGAFGLWQILGQIVPGDLGNPLVNAANAVAKLRTQGLGAWATYTSGAYRQYLGGGHGILGGLAKGIAGSLLGGVGLGGLVNGPSASDIIGKFPGTKGLGMFAGLGKYVIGKATAFVKDHVGAALGGGGGAASGPNGVGSFAGVPMANWVAQALQYAQGKLGYALHPTSGYRPGFDPHTVSGHSEHSGTQYPHGAVDFGGYHDAAALAVKMAVVNATRDFKWPLLAPAGFVDDGHASGTGHKRGGMWGGVLGSYKDGTTFVPQTGLYALHRGEAVVPAARMAKGGIFGGTSKHPTYNGFDIAFLLRQLGLPVGNATQNKIRLLQYIRQGGTTGIVPRKGQGTGGTGVATDTGSGGDPNQPLIDAITAQTEADNALRDQLKAVQGSIDAQTAFATGVSNTSNYQLTKTLADLLSGHIVGYGVAGRAFTPGTGVEVAY